MKRYIIPIFLLCFLLSGCKVVSDDIISVNQQDFSAIPQKPRPTIPTNPYEPTDFETEGEFVTCVTGDYRIGIDISAWQEEVDWQQVADAGVDFVILRIAWRGSEKGVLAEDTCFRSHYEGATAAGLDVGCYFFSQAVSPEEAMEEAEYALSILEDRPLQMPLFFDWEELSPNYRTNKMDVRTLTDCVKAFCERVKEAGYEPGIYFNPDLSGRLLYLEELTDYRFWLALYGTEMNYRYKVDLWQYTNTGRVPGIEGDVDLNIHLIYENGGTNHE